VALVAAGLWLAATPNGPRGWPGPRPSRSRRRSARRTWTTPPLAWHPILCRRSSSRSVWIRRELPRPIGGICLT